LYVSYILRTILNGFLPRPAFGYLTKTTRVLYRSLGRPLYIPPKTLCFIRHTVRVSFVSELVPFPPNLCDWIITVICALHKANPNALSSSDPGTTSTPPHDIQKRRNALAQSCDTQRSDDGIQQTPIHPPVWAVSPFQPLIRLTEMTIAEESPAGAQRGRVLKKLRARAPIISTSRRSGAHADRSETPTHRTRENQVFGLLGLSSARARNKTDAKGEKKMLSASNEKKKESGNEEKKRMGCVEGVHEGRDPPLCQVGAERSPC
jgi:hypothetical protein